MTTVLVPPHIYKLARFQPRMGADEVERANRYLLQYRKEPTDGILAEAPQGYVWAVVDGRNQLVAE